MSADAWFLTATLTAITIIAVLLERAMTRISDDSSHDQWPPMTHNAEKDAPAVYRDRVASLLYWVDHPNSLWQPQGQAVKQKYLNYADALIDPFEERDEGFPLRSADALVEHLADLGRRGHDEDCAATYGLGDPCNCGADDINDEIDETLAALTTPLPPVNADVPLPAEGGGLRKSGDQA